MRKNSWYIYKSAYIFKHLSCYNKIASTRQHLKTNIYFSQFWILGHPRSRCWQIQCLARASWFIDDAFSLFSHLAEEARGLSGAPFIRALFLPVRAPPSIPWPNHLPKTPPNTLSIAGYNLNTEFGVQGAGGRGGFLGAVSGKEHLPVQETRETQVPSLFQEDLLEQGMATNCSTLAWRIQWTEEPGRLQSVRSQRVGHDWATKHRSRHKHSDYKYIYNTGKFYKEILTF